MTVKRKGKWTPAFADDLAIFIRNGKRMAIRSSLKIIEANSTVKIIAVDVPTDSIIFGVKYVEEQERIAEEEEAMISALDIETLSLIDGNVE